MAISGLVVTLDDDAGAAAQALRSLSVDPRLQVGDAVGSRLPLVAETPSAECDAALWADLLATPGVKCVDVTFVSVESPQDSDIEPSLSGRDS